MYNESEIDNALIQIKNQLWEEANGLKRDIDHMPTIRVELLRFHGIVSKLTVMRPLWKALRYSYKGREIAANLTEIAHNWMSSMANSGKCHDSSLLLGAWELAAQLSNAFHEDQMAVEHP